ncbi:hypothetical protein PZW00_07495 [Klebsiella pneumoniae]|uniref:hypothetical protein n=1 Tax=Klebsiella pneumoniae TaxID=573 RepID=UPI0023B11DE5|nr:hypothetical protein [Klebsiella pneumoniae]MDE8894924.1 hypothetical protein [Klebsiella pneumoniae]
MDNEFNIDSSNQNLFTGPSYMQVTVNIDNVEKTLLKFEQKKNGDVLMYCKHAQFHRDPGETSNNDNKIKQQRYSFHKSLDSENNINFIKQTLEISTPGIINTHIVTPVIKNNTGFIHVFSRRAPNLSFDRYNSKKKDKYKTLCIGDLDCASSTLFYSLFIGSSTQHSSDKKSESNVLTFIIGGFKFMFTWAYLPLPSHKSGCLIHSGTTMGDEGNIIGQSKGVDEKGAIQQSLMFFRKLIHEYDITLHVQEKLPINFVTNLFNVTGLLKGGCRSSPDRIKLAKRMIQDGSIVNYQLTAKK